MIEKTKQTFAKIWNIFESNTSGWPFIFWAIGGGAVAIFIFIFRDYENIDFAKLAFILPFGGLWLLCSDVAKKKKKFIFSSDFHFFADSVVFVFLLGSIVYLTGGFMGHLFFVLFLGVVSAPFFGSTFSVIIFFLFLIFSGFLIFKMTGDLADLSDAYHWGIIALQSVFYITIGGITKYFVTKSGEDERRAKVEAEKLVEKRTAELNEKVGQLEKFQELTVGRELKMIELKKEIELLKNKKP